MWCTENYENSYHGRYSNIIFHKHKNYYQSFGFFSMIYSCINIFPSVKHLKPHCSFINEEIAKCRISMDFLASSFNIFVYGSCNLDKRVPSLIDPFTDIKIHCILTPHILASINEKKKRDMTTCCSIISHAFLM